MSRNAPTATVTVAQSIAQQIRTVNNLFADQVTVSQSSIFRTMGDLCGDELVLLFRLAHRFLFLRRSMGDLREHGVHREVCDICHEQIHSAVHWSEVGQHWRDALALIVWMTALAKTDRVFSSHITDDNSSDNMQRRVDVAREVIQEVDVGLMLAGNTTHSVVCEGMHQLVQLLHDWLVECIGPPPLPDCEFSCQNVSMAEKEGQGEEEEREAKRRRVIGHEEEVALRFGIERVDGRRLGIVEFDRKFLRTCTPVVFSHAADHWPHRDKWSRSSLCQYINHIAGYRTVPVEMGTDYTREDWSQRLITMNEFIANHVLPSSSGRSEQDNNTERPRAYLAQHQLFEQIRPLRRDILEPEYCALGQGEMRQVNAWFGADSVSPLHTDPYDNLFIQLCGSKYVRLYSADVSDRLYPAVDSVLTNTSQVVDIFDEETIVDQYPLFAKAPYSDCLLREGEMLFIPKGTWHYIQTIDIPSFSVSFWWQ